MTKNQSSLFRFILFFAGGGIILLAFSLLTQGRELTAAGIFMWVSIGIMYIVLFAPLFFSSITIENFSRKIPSLPLLWFGIILYIAASIAVIVLLMKSLYISSVKTAIIIQSVLAFLFLIDVYLAFFASSHAANVAGEEASKRWFIAEIKSKAQILSLSAGRLPVEYEAAQKILRQALETIKYIYPVDGGAGDDLELQIIASVNTLSELCGGVSSGAHPANIETEAAALLALVKERKLLRN